MIRQGQRIKAADINRIPRNTMDSIAGTGGRLQVGDNLVLQSHPGRNTTLFLAAVEDFSEDGEYLLCVGYDSVSGVFGTTQFAVNKPVIFLPSYWDGVTQTTLGDGVDITYDATDLDITYQRRATWNSGASSEIQAITSPYYYHELIVVTRTFEGLLIDTNQAGRHWAAE